MILKSDIKIENRKALIELLNKNITFDRPISIYIVYDHLSEIITIRTKYWHKNNVEDSSNYFKFSVFEELGITKKINYE